MQEKDERHGQGGFALNSWANLQSLISIVIFMAGGIVWGMKLEARYDLLASKIEVMQQQVSRGVLPITAVRLDTLDERVRTLSAYVDECLKSNQRQDNGQRR